MADVFHNSGLARLRQCEQQYTYEYIDGLKPRKLNDKMVLGSWFHALMQMYSLRKGMREGTLLELPDTIDLGFDRIPELRTDYTESDNPCMHTEDGQAWPLTPEGAHTAITELFYDYLPKMEGDEWTGMPDKVKFLFKRYVKRWEQETAREKVLLVEYEWQRSNKAGHLFGGKADLVVERDGMIVIRDHKTTGQKPGADYRLRNSQLHLYAWGMAPVISELTGREPDAVEYDYAITRDVASVTLTKTGRMRSNQATMDPYAFEVLFDKAVKDWYAEHGDEYGEPTSALEDYDEFLAKCHESEVVDGKFFSREVMPVNVTVIRRLLNENNNLIDRMQELADGAQPIANTSKACRWCSYADLCIGDMYGNDNSVLIAEYFVKES